MSPAGLAELAKAGKIASGAGTPLAKAGVGVGVKAGAPIPDIATVAAFKAAMLSAKSVAYIDPAAGGSSGTSQPEAAKAFLAAMAGSAAQAILKEIRHDAALNPNRYWTHRRRTPIDWTKR